MEKLLVSPTEAAEIIGVGRTRMYEMIASRAIPSVRIGRSVRIPVEGIREWVNAQQTDALELESGERRYLSVGPKRGQRDR